MMTTWKTLRQILSRSAPHKDLMLTMIDEDGTIVSANTMMAKTLHLKNIRTDRISLFDLLHPFSISDFKNSLRDCNEKNQAFSTELYLRNGYYHPVKWQVNFLYSPEANKKMYLCSGYKLIDDERLHAFNRLGEENYHSIVEGLNAGILFQDTRGELIAVNQKLAEVFGTTLERLYQLRNIQAMWEGSWQVTTEDGRPIPFAETPFMRAAGSCKVQQQVLIITLQNGEKKWISFNSQPLCDGNGSKPYAIISGVSDITREKKLISEITRRKALFRSFMDNTPNLAWVVNEREQLVFANSAFYQYFFLTEQDVAGKSIVSFLPGAVTRSLYGKHRQVLETGKAIDVIENVKLATGAGYVFHINIFPINGIDGEKLVGGQAVNIADKYAAEKQLREANDRLLLLSRATTDCIWEWDMQTGKIFRNDALMDMIGYSQEQTQGLSWWLRRIHPEDRNRISDKVKETTERHSYSWEERYRFKCADGQYKFMQDRGFVVYENGLPVKMIGSLQDITDLKELEGQLIEEKIQHQQEISETIIRVQEKERTRLGHELHDNVNQILSTVKLFVDMLTPADAHEKEIKTKSLDYILMAISEIRKLSKELVSPQLIANGLVNSIQTMVTDIAASGALHLRFIHDHENYPISPGKKLALFRIAQEQIKNILTYSKAATARIRLSSDGSFVTLRIEDDGVGFDPKQTCRGIGLSNIHERTRFYKGNVELISSPGNGCTLIVSLPVL